MPETVLHSDEEINASRKHRVCKGSKAPCRNAGDEAVINRNGYEQYPRDSPSICKRSEKEVGYRNDDGLRQGIKESCYTGPWLGKIVVIFVLVI